VLLHPANYDPFPLIILEPMSWSKPIIGTIISGSVEERVENGINGFTVPSGNVEAIVQAML
jgi:glycosyltransferase involved in cell wall biosynthesis